MPEIAMHAIKIKVLCSHCAILQTTPYKKVNKNKLIKYGLRGTNRLLIRLLNTCLTK
uniref:Uncharacterized protein n=1 Tax=Anguilla anguilla TaxID=7936 RepID=A0A0E9R9A8_ANGAN